MVRLLITGPTSVGKTSYANKLKNFYIIDSDEVWFELADKYKWNKELISKNLYESMIKKELLTDNLNVAYVDNQVKPLTEIFKKNKMLYKIVLVGSNLKRLALNTNMRGNRKISGVLKDYQLFFGITENKQRDNIFLRKEHLSLFNVKTKKDNKEIETFKKKYFLNDKKTVKVYPLIKYDKLVVIK